MGDLSRGELATLISARSRPMFIDDDDEKKPTSPFTQWSSSDGTNFFPSQKPRPVLPPGVYEIKTQQGRGEFFSKIDVVTDGIILFPDSVFNGVINEIKQFWASEDMYKQYKLTYKRGILLHGPAGSGKTSLIQLVMADVIKRGGVVVKFDSPHTFNDGIKMFRTIQPDTPLVILMEDIDSIIEYWSESEVLNILDGVNRIDKVVFLATTNYPEKLGDRVINRPSRFDKRFCVSRPNDASRKLFIQTLVSGMKGKKTVDIAKWVKDTDDLSTAHIKELFTAVVILGDKYDIALETIRSMKEKTSSDKDDGKKGIGFNDDDDD